MTPAGLVSIELREQILRVCLERVEEPEARGFIAHDHRVPNQRGQQGKRVTEIVTGDRFGGAQVKPAREGAESREELLLLIGQQVDAPVDRPAQGLLARGGVSRTFDEEVESVLQ